MQKHGARAPHYAPVSTDRVQIWTTYTTVCDGHFNIIIAGRLPSVPVPYTMCPSRTFRPNSTRWKSLQRWISRIAYPSGMLLVCLCLFPHARTLAICLSTFTNPYSPKDSRLFRGTWRTRSLATHGVGRYRRACVCDDVVLSKAWTTPRAHTRRRGP